MTLSEYIEDLKKRSLIKHDDLGHDVPAPEGKEIYRWIKSQPNQWAAEEDMLHLAAHMWRDLKAAYEREAPCNIERSVSA